MAALMTDLSANQFSLLTTLQYMTPLVNLASDERLSSDMNKMSSFR
ncbi:hypothetical protein VRK_20380 [Vibrio sp. MEBiC08052]|nr:hypothetical protein VRK_20380 [Vibrio sp. MEBiC08052]